MKTEFYSKNFATNTDNYEIIFEEENGSIYIIVNWCSESVNEKNELCSFEIPLKVAESMGIVLNTMVKYVGLGSGVSE